MSIAFTNRKKIVALTIVIIASGVWAVSRSVQRVPDLDSAPHIQLGKIAATEMAHVVKSQGNLMVLMRNTDVLPDMKAQWSAFAKELKRTAPQVNVLPILIDEDTFQQAEWREGIPLGFLRHLLSAHPQVNGVWSFVGVPELSMYSLGETEKPIQQCPPIGAVAGITEELIAGLRNGTVVFAIVPYTPDTDKLSPSPLTGYPAFDKSFRILRTKDFSAGNGEKDSRL